MEYQNDQYGRQSLGGQQTLPNATTVLILGILSIVGCFCFGGLGLISGIIALVLANKDMQLYNSNSAAYTRSSYNNLNTGRICAIIGVSISVISTIFLLVMIMKFGTGFFTNPGDYINQYDR